MAKGGNFKDISKIKNKLREFEDKYKDIPEELLDQPIDIKDAYLEWKDLDDKIHNHKDRFVPIPTPDDPNEIVDLDLIMAIPWIRKKIAHLPKEEIARIEKLWQGIQSLKGKKGALKSRWNGASKRRGLKTVFELKKTEILELFGKFYSVNEVVTVLKKDWGYDTVTSYEVDKFRMANINKIKQLREKWESEVSDFPLVKKRGRIEQLSYIYKRNKDKYEDNDYSTTYSKELRGILEQIRKEVEGDKIAIDINGQINVDITLQVNKSLATLSRQISLNTLIVAMVSARKNIDPVHILAELQSSFYSKYNGFGGIIQKGDLQDNNHLPSKLAYDWITIQKANAVETEYEEIETEVSNELRPQVRTDREKLMELLAMKVKDAKKSSDRLESLSE